MVAAVVGAVVYSRRGSGGSSRGGGASSRKGPKQYGGKSVAMKSTGAKGKKGKKGSKFIKGSGVNMDSYV